MKSALAILLAQFLACVTCWQVVHGKIGTKEVLIIAPLCLALWGASFVFQWSEE